MFKIGTLKLGAVNITIGFWKYWLFPPCFLVLRFSAMLCFVLDFYLQRVKWMETDLGPKMIFWIVLIIYNGYL